MLSYSQSLEIVNERLKVIAKEKQPEELYEPIRYILSIGGKRIRPCLAIMAHSLFSEKQNEVIDAAIGIEVFHNFTLMHDDIMDNASIRRNKTTVHEKWNNNIAILSGDAMLILAYQLITNSKTSVLSPLLKLFNKTALEVCEGQQFDMNFEQRKNVTVEEYLEMIRLKTAVLIAASLATGAICASAEDTDVEALYQFGINIGIAFQLQDDYLDVFSDTEKFGKSTGGDIVANKKTFLLISALNSGNNQLVEELSAWIDKSSFHPKDKISAVKHIYTELMIGEKTQELSKKYFSRADDFLNKLNIQKEKTLELKNLVELILKKREH